MENYTIDDSLKHVKLQVQAGVVGIAVSRVDLKFEGKYTKLFNSESGSGGNIPPAKVGINRKLKDSMLRVRTSINLSNLPPELREKAIETIFIIYGLEGGPEGEKKYQAFQNEVMKIDDLNVIVTKKITFI